MQLKNHASPARGKGDCTILGVRTHSALKDNKSNGVAWLNSLYHCTKYELSVEKRPYGLRLHPNMDAGLRGLARTSRKTSPRRMLIDPIKCLTEPMKCLQVSYVTYRASKCVFYTLRIRSRIASHRIAAPFVRCQCRKR